MTHLPVKQRTALTGLVSAMPHPLLKALNRALVQSKDQQLMQVCEIVATEIENRLVREAVFANFMPLFTPRNDELTAKRFSAWILPRLWELLKETEAPLIGRASSEVKSGNSSDAQPAAFSDLIKAAAALCRLKSSLLKPAYIQEDVRDELEDCAHYLDLNRVAHEALLRLNDFVSRPSDDRAATLKLFYKDACSINESSGVRLLEILFSNMSDPIQILKIISTISDHPNDRFMAGSELAGFGERFLNYLEISSQKLMQVLRGRAEDASLYAQSGRLMAEYLRQINIFQKSIELTKDGPWGRRLAVVQARLVESIEENIRACERRITDVLPVNRARSGRNMPRLDRVPRPEQIEALKFCLNFMREVQPVAAMSGFASLIKKTFETLEREVDDYFEGLLAIAHDEDAFEYTPLMLAFDRLEDIMHHLCGDEKAILARRRVACIPAIASYKNLAS